jgi:hypothetical protein
MIPISKLIPRFMCDGIMLGSPSEINTPIPHTSIVAIEIATTGKAIMHR